MTYIIHVLLAGTIYTATPATYATLAECERVAVVLRMTARRAKYRCVAI